MLRKIQKVISLVLVFSLMFMVVGTVGIDNEVEASSAYEDVREDIEELDNNEMKEIKGGISSPSPSPSPPDDDDDDDSPEPYEHYNKDYSWFKNDGSYHLVDSYEESNSNNYYVQYPRLIGEARRYQNTVTPYYNSSYSNSAPFSLEVAEYDSVETGGSIEVSTGYKNILGAMTSLDYNRTNSREIRSDRGNKVSPRHTGFWVTVADYNFEEGILAEYDADYKGEEQYQEYEDYVVVENRGISIDFYEKEGQHREEWFRVREQERGEITFSNGVVLLSQEYHRYEDGLHGWEPTWSGDFDPVSNPAVSFNPEWIPEIEEESNSWF